MTEDIATLLAAADVPQKMHFTYHFQILALAVGLTMAMRRNVIPEDLVQPAANVEQAFTARSTVPLLSLSNINFSLSTTFITSTTTLLPNSSNDSIECSQTKDISSWLGKTGLPKWLHWLTRTGGRQSFNWSTRSMPQSSIIPGVISRKTKWTDKHHRTCQLHFSGLFRDCTPEFGSAAGEDRSESVKDTPSTGQDNGPRVITEPKSS